MATMTHLRQLQRKVKLRLVSVLDARLGDLLALEQADTGLDAAYFAAPSLDAYELAQTPNVADRLIGSKTTIITIASDRDAVYTRLSGAGAIASQLVTYRYLITLSLAFDDGETGTLAGKALTTQELAEVVVDAWRGSIIEALQKHAPGAGGVQDVQPAVDFVDSVQDVETGIVIGRARIELLIKAQGQHPTPTYEA